MFKSRPVAYQRDISDISDISSYAAVLSVEYYIKLYFNTFVFVSILLCSHMYVCIDDIYDHFTYPHATYMIMITIITCN
jgi:hypothetical protein